jgi:UDP-N-acetylglucosamine--N-acetylmuramyl-(pentapeptide) pyrophosphoryl-undecaprenol N-acetylglucosamine transferase
MKVVVAGGGTAGHIYPAVALAAALVPDEVVFLGTSRGAEAELVPRAGFPLSTIEVSGFDRSRPLTIFATAARATKAVVEARAVFGGIQPRVVVGMGGYVSLPAVLAARSKGIPVVLHEQNIVLGLANRAARPLAKVVAVSFEESLADAGRRGVFVGNPVRPELTHLDRDPARKAAYPAYDLDPDRKTLLVFGGSQGARRLNEAALGLTRIWAERDDVQVLHIAGRVEAPKFTQRVAEEAPSRLVYRVVDYVEDMSGPYSVADLAICRGGASTVAELGVVGIPAIIVPYPYHRDRQQERHGRVLERAGAAMVLDDAAVTNTRIAREVERLIRDGDLESMRAAALGAGRPHAADRLAEIVREAAQ